MKKPEELSRLLTEMYKETKEGRIRWSLQVQTTEHNNPSEKPVEVEDGVSWTIDECYVSYVCNYKGKDFASALKGKLCSLLNIPKLPDTEEQNGPKQPKPQEQDEELFNTLVDHYYVETGCDMPQNMQNAVALGLCQSKEHAADKLTADVTGKRIFACAQRTFDGNSLVGLCKVQAMLAAECLIRCHGARQKRCGARKGHFVLGKQAQREHKAHGASALAAEQRSARRF